MATTTTAATTTHPAKRPTTSPITTSENRELSTAGVTSLPRLIADAGDTAARRFVEFFSANIRNPGTREVYARAARRFSNWCEERGLALPQLQPVLVAAYIEQLGKEVSRPTVKLHLAALRMLFDYLVVGQVLPSNPAHAVRGPKHVVKKGKTPVLSAAEARHLLDTIDAPKCPRCRRRQLRGDAAKTMSCRNQTCGKEIQVPGLRETLAGVRDRALIGAMVYSFARVSAVVHMNCEDYYQERTKWWFGLREKGGKRHAVPAHHNAAEYMEAYLRAAGIDMTDPANKKQPIFRSINAKRRLTERRLDRTEVYRMIKRWARQAGLSARISCHTFRATGITAYLENGGTIEKAQQIAAHESPRTTKLYDRTADQVSLDEIERLVI